MSLILKYQGRTLNVTRTERVYKETWSGFQNEIDNITTTQGIVLEIGTYVENKGYLTGIYKSQEDGPLWNLQLEYSLSYENTISNAASTVVGQKSAQLSTRTLQIPLERLSTYKACWNHFLASCDSDTAPDWWSTATNTNLSESQMQSYQWFDTAGECNYIDGEGKKWKQIEGPTKPGVEYVEYSYYVVTERRKYNSASSAGSALDKRLNRICQPSNTFGVSATNWKLDAGQIYYDGKMWILTNTYSSSPDIGDPPGWDTDLYRTTSSGGGSGTIIPLGGGD